MDVSIFVETAFDDGETKRRNIGRLRRAAQEFSSENLGLLLDNAKTLLRRLQEAIVQDQVGEAIQARRKCDGCAKQRSIHDEYQKRHLDVVVGEVGSPNMSRRFVLVQQATSSPAQRLRHDLIAQGWDGQSKVTVISDGEPALPHLVRRAVRGPVTHILDWGHISMRVKHIENAVRGLLELKGFSGVPLFFERPADTLRW